MRRLGIAALALLAACGTSRDATRTPSERDPCVAPDVDYDAALRELLAKLEQPDVSSDLAAARRVFDDWGKDHDDTALVLMARMTRDGEHAALRWPLVHLLLDRDHADVAAWHVVHDLQDQRDQASYRTWKWFEYMYQADADIRERGVRFGHGLVAVFGNGDREQRLTVLAILGLDASLVDASTEELAAAARLPQ